VGGALRLDGSQTLTEWARIQTATMDAMITVTFPNASSGGFFVDGFEGRVKHGEDGFFTADKPAKLGSTLLINYGQ
jgi:hypothetical protein